jgi:DNA polymerase-3 subunit gamma/tau
MSYQVIARKFRPQVFSDVMGQDAIVKTLRFALKSNRIAHAYLFCGLRGTGKTTLARIFAKALNCENRLETIDPCGQCANCQNFEKGAMLDFIEIDGASHRGIEEIKNIIDTIAYSSGSSYKIILIDEVHMLTKEAFNALLKTLEEPPEHVKFIFATTEVHKLLPTILSRCQRFDLARISLGTIVEKLKKVAKSLEINVDEVIFEMVAERAEGSMRDAESLFERVLTGQQNNQLTLESTYEMLGYFHHDQIHELDLAFLNKDLKAAFLIGDKLIASGKDAKLFFEQYRTHLRHILCHKLSLSSFVKQQTSSKEIAEKFSIQEVSYLIELLTQELRFQVFDKRIDVEALLLLIIQSASRASLNEIVEKLENLASESLEFSDENEQIPQESTPLKEQVIATQTPIVEQSQPEIEQKQALVETKLEEVSLPTQAKQEAPALKKVGFYDTLMQFTAVELEGSLKK